MGKIKTLISLECKSLNCFQILFIVSEESIQTDSSLETVCVISLYLFLTFSFADEVFEKLISGFFASS